MESAIPGTDRHLVFMPRGWPSAWPLGVGDSLNWHSGICVHLSVPRFELGEQSSSYNSHCHIILFRLRKRDGTLNKITPSIKTTKIILKYLPLLNRTLTCVPSVTRSCSKVACLLWRAATLFASFPSSSGIECCFSWNTQQMPIYTSRRRFSTNVSKGRLQNKNNRISITFFQSKFNKITIII